MWGLPTMARIEADTGIPVVYQMFASYLGLSVIFTCLYRMFFMDSGSTVKHLFFIVTGCILGYTTMGAYYNVTLANAMILYILWILIGPKYARYIHIPVLIFQIVYLNWQDPDIVVNSDNVMYFSLSHFMVVFLKLGSCSITAGGPTDERHRQAGTRTDGPKPGTDGPKPGTDGPRPRLPNLLQLLGYTTNYSDSLGTSNFSYETYLDGIERHSDHQGSLYSGLKLLAAALGLIAMSQAIYASESLALTDNSTGPNFARSPVTRQVFYLVLLGKVSIMQLMGLQLLSESWSTFTEFSYNGRREDGSNRWDGLTTNHAAKVIFNRELKEFIRSYNLQTNLCFKRVVFNNLRGVNITLAKFATLYSLALWHGPYYGYMFTFTYEFITLQAETKFLAFVKGTRNPVLRMTGLVLWALVAQWIMGVAMAHRTTLYWTPSWQFIHDHYWLPIVVPAVLLLLPFHKLAPKPRLESKKEN